MIKVSDELLNDSVFDVQAYIVKEFARRISTKEEEAFFVGDGAGKPVGIFNATGGGEVGVTTTTANVTFDDVMDELYATTGQVGFLASQRVDGKLILPEAVKLLSMKSA